MEHRPFKDNQVIMKIQLDSASPVTFLIRNLRHEMKLRDPYLKLHRMGRMTKDLYFGFTDMCINIISKLGISVFSNAWSLEQCHFSYECHERNLLGNEKLAKVGIDVSQKHFPHTQMTKKKQVERKILLPLITTGKLNIYPRSLNSNSNGSETSIFGETYAIFTNL